MTFFPSFAMLICLCNQQSVCFVFIFCLVIFIFQWESKSLWMELMSLTQKMRMRVGVIFPTCHIKCVHGAYFGPCQTNSFFNDFVCLQIFLETLISVTRLCNSLPDMSHRKSFILFLFRQFLPGTCYLDLFCCERFQHKDSFSVL